MESQIILCLSGGGFRATIFHLGVLDYLAQSGRLNMVKSIYAVSGGALTAAHLSHHWEEYTNIESFPSAAVRLLEYCHHGVIENIVISSVISNATRSNRFEKTIHPLFDIPIPASARPTYLVSSSLTDMSQFAVEIKSRRLYRCGKDEETPRDLGKSSLSTSRAVAMSASFPLVFEPTYLSPGITGLDMSALGKIHLVADGGIVDNLGIKMAFSNENARSNGCIYLVSDAGPIFDELEPGQGSVTFLSPLRTVDYLMNQNADTVVKTTRSRIADDGARLAIVSLNAARRVVNELDIGVEPALIHAVTRMRTNLDACSIVEITSLYRLGLLLAQEQLSVDTFDDPSIKSNGLIEAQTIDGHSLQRPWKEIALCPQMEKRGSAVDLFFKNPRIFVFCALLSIIGIASLFGIVFSLFFQQ